MRALLLSAGQGSRLLPLTERLPKCLLPIAGRPLIEWQIRELGRAGVDDFVVVVGFEAHLVEDVLAGLRRPGVSIRTVFNPFFNLADNLGSCWHARRAMDRDFAIVNGDTLFPAAVAERLFAAAPAPITVAVDRKDGYDADDMKVRIEGSRLIEIGKLLPLARVNGESIGFVLIRGDGPRLFRDAVERAMRTPEGLRWWYLMVIGQLAERGLVETLSIEGLPWGEVDYTADLAYAESLVRRWLADEETVRLRRGASG